MWLRSPLRRAGHPRHIRIVNGHPDPDASRFCAALARAYLEGVRSAEGHAEAFTLASMGERDWERACSAHRGEWRLVAVFPLWLDKAPAPMTRFVSRMQGCAGAECIVTMDLPGLMARTSGASLGFGPLPIERTTVIGSVGSLSPVQRERRLERVRMLGAQAAMPGRPQRIRPRCQTAGLAPSWAEPAPA